MEAGDEAWPTYTPIPNVSFFPYDVSVWESVADVVMNNEQQAALQPYSFQ
jgi:hypothetical protein